MPSSFLSLSLVNSEKSPWPGRRGVVEQFLLDHKAIAFVDIGHAVGSAVVIHPCYHQHMVEAFILGDSLANKQIEPVSWLEWILSPIITANAFIYPDIVVFCRRKEFLLESIESVALRIILTGQSSHISCGLASSGR